MELLGMIVMFLFLFFLGIAYPGTVIIGTLIGYFVNPIIGVIAGFIIWRTIEWP